MSVDAARVDAKDVVDSGAGLDGAIEAAAPPAPEGMLWVPAGTFTMGTDRGGEEDEHPAHRVTLPGFFLDQTPVTNEAYDACVRATACAALVGRDAKYTPPKHPANTATWDEAKAYCAWRGARLPREAEYERAMRGDDARAYAWGDDSSHVRARRLRPPAQDGLDGRRRDAPARPRSVWPRRSRGQRMGMGRRRIRPIRVPQKNRRSRRPRNVRGNSGDPRRAARARPSRLHGLEPDPAHLRARPSRRRLQLRRRGLARHESRPPPRTLSARHGRIPLRQRLALQMRKAAVVSHSGQFRNRFDRTGSGHSKRPSTHTWRRPRVSQWAGRQTARACGRCS